MVLRWQIASVALLISIAASAAAQAVLEVIPLGYRTADQVIPVLRPLLDPQGTISGHQNQLIVRTTPRNLEELKRVLATLDRPPRRLLITVREDAAARGQASAAELSGRAGIGNHGTVVVPPLAPGGEGGLVVRGGRGADSVQAGISAAESSATGRYAQSVHVLEGGEAFIRTGQSVPTRTVTRTVVGGQVIEQVTTSQHQDAMNGFYVRPRVAGDQVTLEIFQQRDSVAGGRTPAIDVRQIATTVSGRLGDWLEIGGSVQSGTAQQAGLLSRRETAQSDSRRVLLRVEEVR